ncbi:pentatricopeptide repeat-containing protein At1g71490-like [Spinacia oleracea]|uniref:Pentatricopeptide repeat-containing protein At1g71490-like n=1 Tax=Spinacia oleracea TaxID=3562 RepID=A0ABM3QXV8_SPIOL|nr:pentatricopeptide repeat-containing protein At1g71490-like [Spinacia oleracea]
MEEKDIISWNSIISGYARYGKYEETSFLFREMLLCGFRPNYVIIASILPLCARVANLQHGKELHCFIIKHQEFSEYLLSWNALVEMYARAAKISEAQKVFNLLSRKDVITYTSLITGYGVLGEGEVAFKLFEEMNSSGIKPDIINNLVAVLSAYSHSGLVIQGQLLFEKMWTVYGIRPCLEHYACMVDFFGRSGLLKKAEEIIRRMSYEPSVDIWATVIGACQIHRNIDLGEWAAEKLLELMPRNPGYYVLIANMYAAAGCWDKLAKVRTFMRELGVLKPPGCAWVDIGSGFEPFLVGDPSMELSYAIYPTLEGLFEHMKDAGYIDVFVIDHADFVEYDKNVTKRLNKLLKRHIHSKNLHKYFMGNRRRMQGAKERDELLGGAVCRQNHLAASFPRFSVESPQLFVRHHSSLSAALSSPAFICPPATKLKSTGFHVASSNHGIISSLIPFTTSRSRVLSSNPLFGVLRACVGASTTIIVASLSALATASASASASANGPHLHLYNQCRTTICTGCPTGTTWYRQNSP